MATDILLKDKEIEFVGKLFTFKENNGTHFKSKILINTTKKEVELSLGDSRTMSGNIVLGATRVSSKLGLITNKSVKCAQVMSTKGEIGELKIGKGFGPTIHDGKVLIYGRTPNKSSIQLDGTRARIGVNTNSPSYSLHVKGTVAALDFKNISDKRCKENIHPLRDSLPLILKLQGVRFDWKDAMITNKDTKKHQIGFIAQDVEKVIPDIVTKDQQGIRSVSYSDLVPYLVESIKSQQSTLKDHEVLLAKQHKRIIALEKQFKTLEDKIAKNTVDQETRNYA